MAKTKRILIICHSQTGTMKRMAERFAEGAAKEDSVSVNLKHAHDI